MSISKGAAHRNMFIAVRCTFGNTHKISATNIEVLCTKLTILFFTRYLKKNADEV
jgi:hypothetical protein